MAAARAVPWLAGRGASLGVLCQINGRGSPDRPALIDEQGTLTWGQLDARVDRLASALTGLGIAPGLSVATLLRNGREQVETILAAQKLGVTVVPLNTWSKAGQLLGTLAVKPPAALVYDIRHAAQLPEPLLGFLRVAVGAGAPAGSVAYEHLIAEGHPRPPGPLTLRRGHPRIVIQTSGTTGRAKGARRDTAGREGLALLGLLSVVPLRRGDVIDCPAPLFHSFGLLALGMSAALGGTLLVPDRFDASQTLERIGRHRADAVVLVPSMLHRLTSLPLRERRERSVGSVRVVLSSGSALSPKLRRRGERLFGDSLYDLYGSTEAGWVAVATPADVALAPGTVGRAVPGVRIAVLDGEKRPVPTRSVGQVHVRSDMAFAGYVGREARRSEAVVATGDLGWLDSAGRLFVTGRADEMVVTGGENVYPVEVEQVIERLEEVEAAAVVGIPDPDLGQALAAHVQIRPGARVSRATILRHCREELPAFKVPKVVRVVEELPRTSTGKVLKRELG